MQVARTERKRQCAYDQRTRDIYFVTRRDTAQGPPTHLTDLGVASNMNMMYEDSFTLGLLDIYG